MAAELGPGRRALVTECMVGVTKAARDLGVGEKTLRRAIATGELPTHVFGRRHRLKVTDVRAWIDAHRQPPRARPR